MTWRLSVEPEAELDIEVADEWHETERRGLGIAFLDAVRAALAAVEREPRIYGELMPGLRRAKLRRFQYLLYFRVQREDVIVIACLDGRRDPLLWQARAGA